MIKPAAIAPRFQVYSYPVIVTEDYTEIKVITYPDYPTTPDYLLVLRIANP
ncbi:MAG: hypothetical protein P8M25_18275 [Paracoccaceae bacterium]|nr:hypothetical protein [Paracoccaceae bacterium]